MRVKCLAQEHNVSRFSKRFSKFPVITGPVKLFCFPFQTGVSKALNHDYTVKLFAKETK